MSIKVALHHQTEYQFERSTTLFPHLIRLKPAAHCRTQIHSYSLNILPSKHFINWQQDPFGNYLARIVFQEPAKRLCIDVEVIAQLTVINPFDFFVDEYAEHFPFQYEASIKKALQPYLECTSSGPNLTRWLETFERFHKEQINDFLVRLNQQLQQDICYSIRMEPGVQTPEETLTLLTGSCRDTAWLLVNILRNLGLAARFVSGYLVQLAPDQKPLEGPPGPEKDFTDLHAWCEVYVPGAGWIGLDPTSGLFAGEGHIPLACTPEPQMAAPITGATSPCEVEFHFTNEVIRINEEPRVTKPYTQEQWQAIKALGNQVDADILNKDIRLTVGGEPTFVSIDDMEAAEWNTQALGTHKLQLAKDLIVRLRDRFAQGGLLHYGQGKWYPGEPLPRWALGCFWRTDSQALWQNPQWLAKVHQDYGHDVNDAERFAESFAKKIRSHPEHLMAAFEDPLHHLWQEQREPINADLVHAQLKDPLERQSLIRRLTQGLNKPVGYVLPIEWDWYEGRWRSGRWQFRHKHLFLIVGDSPMGFRLPLDALPTPEFHYETYLPQADPSEIKLPLPQAGRINEQLRLTSVAADSQWDTATREARQQQTSSSDGYNVFTNNIRTAICFEPRDGKLFVFLPPTGYLEHYVSLIELIEDTAGSLKIPVVIEGYEPPKDYRLKSLLVTPDPGVIEVNIHPSSSFADMNEKLHILYETARESRLGTEKFMLDGRHSGTGGGNHVTLGGATPLESPFLRRPDLLRSLITYWQHHPSLSYLFSGAFIGPTSQAPRVDEGRIETLYELEIAFKELSAQRAPMPWLVDRLLRHLLVDITGNTHRSEFCIDKLYAPGLLSGRQGLIEFRGFEMPPHPQMAMVQVLLLQALIIRFWDTPYQKPLVNWGTSLHDRFLLPHFVWADIKEVVQDLQQSGLAFNLAWLKPFHAFRFPIYGCTKIEDIELTLNWAIEPWHVLGEEIGHSGTTRYVDSSIERLQVRLTGLTPERYLLTCNGRRVHLHATGMQGEFVAGIRYRAWQPPSALHPTIGVHTPLVFDLVDTWNNKSIGGCSYHVSHPGGRHYEVYPVNANEAEARRMHRFASGQHTPGTFNTSSYQYAAPPSRHFQERYHQPIPVNLPPQEQSLEYPYTLDLRHPMI
jgi:uncharacterized protein (DUF2126 family)/transglutaminase-like putative cysteine protease